MAILSPALVFAVELPAFYQTVNRVTWVVENIDKVRPAWEALGLSGIREYPNIQLPGQFRGKPVTIYAWQITGNLGNLTIDMIQPAEGQANAYTEFLARHGDGILSIVHQVPSRRALEDEIRRMESKGVVVLQQVTMGHGPNPWTFTYFDTEAEGKFALGLVYAPGGAPPAAESRVVSHFGAVIRDASAVSAYWERLGFPAQFDREWLAPSPAPPNLYTDFLNQRPSEGIHHIGIPVPDLAKSVAAYEKLGYRVLESGGKPGSRQYVFLNTDSAGGIRVKLVRSD